MAVRSKNININAARMQPADNGSVDRFQGNVFSFVNVTRPLQISKVLVTSGILLQKTLPQDTNTSFAFLSKMLSTLKCLLLLLCLFISTHVINCKGCVPLDSYTFDKIVSKFKASIIKFDVAYPYGPKHDEFTLMSDAAHIIPDLLIGEVGVKDYGEKENADLAERFKISKEDFPVIIMIVSGKPEPFVFSDPEFTADNIKKFIRTKSGIHIGLPGCLESFDRIANLFARTQPVDVKRALLKEAEQLWDNTVGDADKRTGEVYVKMMRKVLEKGDEFVSNELKRVQNLTQGKLSAEKKEEMQQRLNILHSFYHDEL